MRSELRKIVLVIALVAVLAGSMVASVALCNGTVGAAGCTATTPFGWTITLASLFLIIGVAWLLLWQKPDDTTDHISPPNTVACPDCGRSLLDDWRLCPYCGRSADEPVLSEGGAVGS